MVKVKIVAMLEPEQKKALDRLRVLTRVPLNAYIREAVDDLLNKYRRILDAQEADAMARLSEPVFARDWDSKEDSAVAGFNSPPWPSSPLLWL